jgi:hypothetical protein
MSEQPTKDELANARLDILSYQREAKACPEVFAVVIRCDGESSLSNLYGTREAAEVERDYHNKRSSYYGRAHIETYNVLTADLAQRRWK